MKRAGVRRRGIHNDLERKVTDLMNDIDGPASQTIASGSIFGDQDVRSAAYLIQCKNQSSRKSHTITCRSWTALADAARRERTNTGDYRTPLYVTEAWGETLLTMTLTDFSYLIRRTTLR